MPRYGSQSEGFDQTLAQFAARERQRTEIIQKEAEKRKTGAGEEERVQAERTAAREEAVRVGQREQAVADVQVRNAKLDTAAIEQNTAARRANVAAREEQAAAQGRFQARATSTGKSYFVEDTATGQRASGLFRASAGGEERARTAATFASAGARVPAAASQAAQAALTAEAVASQRAAAATEARAVSEREAGSSSRALAIRQDALRPGAAQYGGGPTTGRYSPYAPIGREQYVGPQGAPVRQQGAAQVREESAASREAAAAEAQRVKLARESNSIYAQTAGQNALVARTTREVTAEYGLASNALRRHGALTAEFIAQGAKGEVTMRELGYQTLTTIGKFAGWTAAAGLVYGAFKAITDFGTGAIESQNIIQNLQRFINNLDTDKAKVQLRELALGVNVSFKEAGEAVSGFARIFKNQNDAFLAARQGLILTKLDSISAADSYRSLVAISQGFHFGQDAKPLTTITDQIAAYQREFGARATEVTAGFARAAGPYAVGGGSPGVLGALLATGVQGGLTGPVVATALGRSATTFRYKPDNQAILKSYGVDPTGNYDTVINSVMQTIKKRGLGGDDIRQLAIGLGGPQLGARTFTVLLNNYQKYLEILKDTTPEKVKGKSQEELNTKLGQFSEIAKSVSVGLQAIGSSLEQSGALVPIQGMLLVLREVFRTTQDITSAFATMGPVVKGVLGVGLAAGAAGLLRGSTALARIPVLRRFASDGANENLEVRRGLDVQKTAVADARAAIASTAVRTQIQAEAAQGRLDEYQAQRGAVRNLPVGHPDREVYDRRVAVLASESKAAQERGNVALAELTQAKKIALRTEEEIANIDKTRAEATVFGIPTKARPSTADLNRYGPKIRGGEAVSESGLIVPGAAKAAAQDAEKVAEKEASAAGRDIESIGAAARRGLDKTASVAKGITGVPGKLRAGLNNLRSSFGVFDALFAAMIGFEAINALADSIDQKHLKDPHSLEGSTDRFVSNLNDVAHLRAPTYDDRRAEQQAKAEGTSQLKYTDAIEQARARRRGGPIPEQQFSQVQQQISADAQAFTKGQISFGELGRRMATHAVELKTSQYVTSAQVKQGRDAIASAVADASGQKTGVYLQEISKMSEKALDAEIQTQVRDLKSFGGESAQGKLSKSHLQAIEQLSGIRAYRRGDQASADAYAKRRETISAALQAAVDDDLKVNLALAGTQGGRDDAYRRAEQETIANVAPQRRIVTTLEHSLNTAKARQRDAQQALKDARGKAAAGDLAGPGGDRPQGYGDPQLEESRAKAAAAKAAGEIKANSGALGKARSDYRQALREAQAARLALEASQVQEDNALRSAQGTLAVSRLGPYADPVTAARQQVSTAQGNLSEILAHRRAFKPVDIVNAYNDVQTAQNNLIKAADDQAKQLADATFDLKSARDEGDPIAQAKDAVGKANADLARAKTPLERLQALKAQVDANNALQKAIQDREQARYTYLESLTTDPLKIDAYQIKADTAAVSHAKKGTADWYRAMAQLNKDKQKLADDTLTGKEDDIQFDLDMDKITRQDAISRYQALLKSKNLTKAQQRDLQRKIADLNKQITQDAGGFDVNLGSIKLPTSLDVRRAIKGATDFRDSAISARQFQTNATINIYAQGGPGTAADVADGIDRILTTSVRASMRTAGIR